MRIDRKRFFDHVRPSLFGRRLMQSQVDAMNAILDECERRRIGDRRQIAYMLATAKHEPGGSMRAVREAHGRSEADTIRKLDAAWAAGKLPQVKRPYWRRDAQGKAWFGRGLVQLTNKENYARVGERLGLDLVGNPDVALRLDVAVKVLVVGMVEGLFTGHKLSDHINASRCDYVKARQIVNGLDRAELIAGYARNFEAALRAADMAGEVPIARDREWPVRQPQPPARQSCIKLIVGLVLAAAAAAAAWLKIGG